MPKPKRDFTQVAHAVFRHAIGEAPAPTLPTADLVALADALAEDLDNTRAECANIEAAIQAHRQELGKLRAELAEGERALSWVQARAGAQNGAPQSRFYNFTLRDAACTVLRELDRPAKTTEIAKAVKEGGIRSYSTKLLTTLFIVLKRETEKQSPRVRKTGAGEWEALPSVDGK